MLLYFPSYPVFHRSSNVVGGEASTPEHVERRASMSAAEYEHLVLEDDDSTSEVAGVDAVTFSENTSGSTSPRTKGDGASKGSEGGGSVGSGTTTPVGMPVGKKSRSRGSSIRNTRATGAPGTPVHASASCGSNMPEAVVSLSSLAVLLDTLTREFHDAMDRR